MSIMAGLSVRVGSRSSTLLATFRRAFSCSLETAGPWSSFLLTSSVDGASPSSSSSDM